MPPDLSVIIPTHNGGPVLGRALEALRAQDTPAEQCGIIVIDSDILVWSDFLQHHLAIHRDAGRPVVGRGPVVLIPTPAIPDRTPQWLRAHGLHTLAFLVMRGVLNRHYLRSLDRFRALPEGR